MQSCVTNWSKQEDKKLTDWVLKQNSKKKLNWKRIAKLIKTKTPKQCITRLKQRKDWKDEQISLLFELHKSLPNMWESITEQLEKIKQQTGDDDILAKRSALEVKNKFNNQFRKGLRKIGKLLMKKQQINQSNFTQPVQDMKSKKFKEILSDQDKKNYIYINVLQCLLIKEEQMNQFFNEKKNILKDIYQMFYNRDVKIDKKISRSKKKNKKQMTQARNQNIQKKQKKIDIKLKKRQSKRTVQNQMIEQNSCSKKSLERFPKPKQIRLESKQKEIKQKNWQCEDAFATKLISEQKQKGMIRRSQSRSIYKQEQIKQQKAEKLQNRTKMQAKKQTQNEIIEQKNSEEKSMPIIQQIQQPNTKIGEYPRMLYYYQIQRAYRVKKIQKNLQYFDRIFNEIDETKQEKKQDLCQDSNRSITRSLAALIKASSKADSNKLPEVALSQNEGMKIKSQVFTSGKGQQ